MFGQYDRCNVRRHEVPTSDPFPLLLLPRSPQASTHNSKLKSKLATCKLQANIVVVSVPCVNTLYLNIDLSHFIAVYIMKSLSIAFIAAVSVIPTAIAFTTVTNTKITRPSTQLHSVEDMRQRIKKAGGGITTVVPGDLKVYDPNEQGKLQGTGDLEARVAAGVSFAGETSSSAPSESPVDTPAATAPSATHGKSRSGTANLTNLLNSAAGSRKDAYGGKSQC